MGGGRAPVGIAFAGAVLRQQLARRGWAELTLRGRSMRPLLAPGTRLRLRRLVPGEQLVGAIVAVDAGPLVILHRVQRVVGSCAITQGLASPAPDQPRDLQAIIGVVCGVAAGSGRHRAWATESRLRLLAALTAILVTLVRRVRGWR